MSQTAQSSQISKISNLSKSMGLRLADFETPHHRPSGTNGATKQYGMELDIESKHSTTNLMELHSMQQQLIQREHEQKQRRDAILKRERDLQEIYKSLEGRYRAKEEHILREQRDIKQLLSQKEEELKKMALKLKESVFVHILIFDSFLIFCFFLFLCPIRATTEGQRVQIDGVSAAETGGERAGAFGERAGVERERGFVA